MTELIPSRCRLLMKLLQKLLRIHLMILLRILLLMAVLVLGAKIDHKNISMALRTWEACVTPILSYNN